MSSEYSLEWQSTPDERYSSDMTERARIIVDGYNLTVTESYGGSGGDVADNGLTILAAEELAVEVAQRIATEVGHDVEVWEYIKGLTNVFVTEVSP